MTQGRKERGIEAENLACEYLQSQGMTCLERNVNTRWGELDLVMADGETIVFVEVRYRKNPVFGHPAETVNARKQGKIRRTVESLLGRGRYPDRPLRFDVVAITSIDGNPVVEWNKNAFD